MRRWRPIFTNRQTLLLGSAVLLAVLLVAGSYFGRHWFYGPDVELVPEHLLSDKSRSVSMNRPVRVSVSQETPSVSESEPISNIVSTLDAEQNEEEEFEDMLKSFSDDELTALAEMLYEDETESNGFPEVPEGFPSNLSVVWLEDYFDENLHADHVIMYRVAIELWNQGEHGFVNVTMDGHTGGVYLLYPGVVYVTRDSYVREGPDGEPIEVPYISSYLGIPSTLEPLLDSDGRLSTESPGVEFVDYNDAGYDPATILDDY